jgi:hypothetical protein
MRKKKTSTHPTVEAARAIGAEAWLAVRARPGAGLHKGKKRGTRAERTRRALDEQT